MAEELETHHVSIVARLPGEDTDEPRWKHKDAVLVEDLRELIEDEIADFDEALFHGSREDYVELKAGRRALQDLLKQIPGEDSVKKSTTEGDKNSN